MTVFFEGNGFFIVATSTGTTADYITILCAGGLFDIHINESMTAILVDTAFRGCRGKD